MFYIGEEIPGDLVLNPIQQEKWGVLAIRKDGPAAPAAKEEPAEPAKKAPAKKSGKKPLEEAGEQ